MGRLEGKVALITGAASALKGEVMGLGGATAWLFAREGAKVALADIEEELGERSASQIREDGGDALFIRLDVTSEQGWIEAIQTVVDRFGRLDILFNNAGGGLNRVEPLEEATVEDWDHILDINAKGVFLGTKHAVPEMRRIGGGSIINMSSMSGIVASPSSAAYSAAKGAIRIFTKAAAIQYAKEKIRVNSIHPGNTLTSRVKRLFPDGDYPDFWTSMPMERLGHADEIAYGVLFLASDESSFMTGSELVIDGGYTAQ